MPNETVIRQKKKRKHRKHIKQEIERAAGCGHQSERAAQASRKSCTQNRAASGTRLSGSSILTNTAREWPTTQMTGQEIFPEAATWGSCWNWDRVLTPRRNWQQKKTRNHRHPKEYDQFSWHDKRVTEREEGGGGPDSLTSKLKSALPPPSLLTLKCTWDHLGESEDPSRTWFGLFYWEVCGNNIWRVEWHLSNLSQL